MSVVRQFTRKTWQGFLLFVLIAACASSPVTGKRQFSLISEKQEIEMGRQADKDVAASIGLYDDAKVRSYVDRLGQALAATSDRSNLKWTFRVVDDPVVNAFALPGGFIYVTRGLMTHLNSEAELAGVMGHEIGHVTARHSVQQISRQQIAGLGLGLGSLLFPDLGQYANVAQAGLGLMFLKYSRDNEREADDLGFRYMKRAGYDPRAMSEVFDVLERVGGNGRIPSWLATHPDPGDRKQRIEEEIASLRNKDFSTRSVDREEYLQVIDGMVFGEDPREGFFKGSTFMHPDLRFQIEFPSQWKTSNQKQAVTAVSAGNDAMIQVALSGKSSPTAAASEFFAKKGVRQGRAWRREINGLPAASAEFQAKIQQGTVSGVASFVSLEGKVYALLGYSTAQKWSSYDSAVERTLASFDRLRDSRALSVQPMRVEIVRPDQTMTKEQFAAQFNSSVPKETLAIINHLGQGGQFEAGQSAKTVVGDASVFTAERR